MNIKQEILQSQLEQKRKEKRRGFSLSHKERERRAREHRMHLKDRLEKAGSELPAGRVSKFVGLFTVLLMIALTVYGWHRLYVSMSDQVGVLITLVVLFWTVGFFVVSAAVWYAFHFILDLFIYKRKQKLELVLPDFLQLVSANIRAGMTVDQSLWFAVRPRFGILAKEIEDVAKHTFAGAPLEEALEVFVKRFDSKVLERAMNLLIEGVRAGGELGELLDKIATDIQETNIMKKEMAANVTTYVIFISFATVVAAPFLFGIAYQLLIAITEIFSKVNLSQGATTGFALQVSEGAIAIGDFQTFAIVSLMITSFFSSIIISTIKKGNIKGGIRYIPMFMASSIILFLLVVRMFGMFVTDIF